MSDGFELNMVCEAPTLTNMMNASKPKKKNKYEKRRDRSKLKDNSKSTLQSNVVSETPSTLSTPLIKDNSGDKSSSKEEEPELSQEVLINSHEKVSQRKESESMLPIVKTSENSTSRKNNLINMEDEEERAKYMAEFHARPMEMDRRAGATSSYTKSQSSSHLFDSHRVLPLHAKLLKVCEDKFNMKQATQIQINTWLKFHEDDQKHNIFVQSETGSGKTLAYLLPIIQSLMVDSEQGDILPKKYRGSAGTLCLIICPTRELATQTFAFVENLTRGTWLVGGCLSGGEKRKSEKARLRKGISILVATPGRLLDHLQKTEALLISLKGKLRFLVLDESDRLMDMGLGSQVEQIVQRIRANQPGSGRDGITWRSLMVSATISQDEESLAKKLLGMDEWIWARADASQQERILLEGSTPRQLSQLHITVTAKLRLATLVAFLAQRVMQGERTVVFMSTCDCVDYHEALFNDMDSILPSEKGFEGKGIFGSRCPIFKLHGSVVHSDRQAILANFNKCKTAVFFCTDVAARGLNLSRVEWIVQYDPPCEIADYAHRVGRAARAGQAGHALLFLLPSERSFLEVLELKGVKNLEALSLAHTLTRAGELCPSVTAECKAGFKNKGEAFSAEIQRRLEDKVIEDDAQTKADQKSTRRKGQPRSQDPCGKLLLMARQAFLSYVRAYPTKEKDVRHIFCSRALHVGHIARSFALKEPPKATVNRVANVNNLENGFDKEKRNASLTFRSMENDSSEPSKKKHKKNDPPKKYVSKNAGNSGSIDTGKARMVLMEQAAKLQQVGMNSL